MYKYLYPYKININKDLTGYPVREKVITGAGHIAVVDGDKEPLTLCGRTRADFTGGGDIYNAAY